MRCSGLRKWGHSIAIFDHGYRERKRRPHVIHANAALPNETRTMLFTAVRATTTLSLRPSLLFSASTRTFSTSIRRLEQFHGADEAVSFVYFRSFAFPVLTRRHKQTFTRVTSATKTNERVVLVDFYAECAVSQVYVILLC